MNALVIENNIFYNNGLPVKHGSILSLPIINIPVLKYLIRFFTHQEISQIGVWVRDAQPITKIVDSKLHVQIFTSLDQIKDFVNTTTIITASNLLPEFSLTDFLAFHNENRSIFTMTMPKHNDDNFLAIVESQVFEEYPSLLEIFSSNRLDFLWRSDIKPIVYDPPGALHVFTNWSEYFDLNMEYLKQNRANDYFYGKNGFWIGEDTIIHSSAYISPPVLIGKNCQIESNVFITGPLIIGENTKIESESSISDCIIFNECLISRNSSFERQIIDSGWIKDVSIYQEPKLTRENRIKVKG